MKPTARWMYQSLALLRRPEYSCRELWILVLLILMPSQQSMAAPTSEQLIRAAYLYNFAVYTEWPGEKLNDVKPSIRICTLGEDNLDEAIYSIKQRTIRFKPLSIVRNVNEQHIKECHVLYTNVLTSAMQQIISEIAIEHHVLWVSNKAMDSQEDGMISLAVEQSRLVFYVNNAKAKSAGLVLSSRLLQLAKGVIP